jgi:hypothetical protein
MHDLQKSIHLTYRALMHVDELRMLDDTPVAASMALSWSGERVGKRGGINHGNSLLWSRPFFDEPRAQATGVHSRGYPDRIRGLTSRLSLFACTTTCFDSPMPLPHIVRPASPPPAHAAHSFSLSHPNPGSSWPARLNQP